MESACDIDAWSRRPQAQLQVVAVVPVCTDSGARDDDEDGGEAVRAADRRRGS